MSAGQDIFKQVMRRWASGVAIVTTRLGAEMHGLTVSGFGGISLEPPLVLVSIGHNQHSHNWIKDSGNYAVNFLRADQADLSDRFARRTAEGEDRFAGIAYRSAVSGAPILEECLAWFDCRLTARHVVGDHTLFVGEVLAGEVVSDAPPLIYYNGAYRPLAAEPERPVERKDEHVNT
ncbi:MAG TPA: flavin reductase family protein [Anaerolineae bacterium]|nr:flavin reductase family protein [Anaerolineae bacterium]